MQQERGRGGVGSPAKKTCDCNSQTHHFEHLSALFFAGGGGSVVAAAAGSESAAAVVHAFVEECSVTVESRAVVAEVASGAPAVLGAGRTLLS